MPSHQFKAAADQGSFEWFFLLIDAGNDRGIWARHGLNPEFVPAASSSVQLKSLIESGIKIGFVNAAEVTLARSSGVPVKIVAAYFGETTARIFVAANGAIKTAKDLNGKKIADLVDNFQNTGTYEVTWNGMNNFGKPVASGVYFYRLQTQNFNETKKLLLMK